MFTTSQNHRAEDLRVSSSRLCTVGLQEHENHKCIGKFLKYSRRINISNMCVSPVYVAVWLEHSFEQSCTVYKFLAIGCLSYSRPSGKCQNFHIATPSLAIQFLIKPALVIPVLCSISLCSNISFLGQKAMIKASCTEGLICLQMDLGSNSQSWWLGDVTEDTVLFQQQRHGTH